MGEIIDGEATPHTRDLPEKSGVRKKRRRKPRTPKARGWRTESLIVNHIRREGVQAMVIVGPGKPFPVMMVEGDPNAPGGILEAHAHLVVALECDTFQDAITLAELALEQWRPGEKPACACGTIGEDYEDVLVGPEGMAAGMLEQVLDHAEQRETQAEILEGLDAQLGELEADLDPGPRLRVVPDDD